MTESHALVVCRDELVQISSYLPASIIGPLRDKLDQNLAGRCGNQSSNDQDPFVSVRIDDHDAEIVAGVRHAVFEAGYTLGLGRIPPSSTPEKRLCFFDMDATLVAEESIVELARAAGKTTEVEEITRAAMAGRIEFRQAFEARLALLKDLSSSSLPGIVAGMTVNPGIDVFAGIAASRGIRSYLVSGGFMEFAQPLIARLHFEKAFAHELIFQEGRFTGRIKGPVIDAERKAALLQDEMSAAGCTPADTIAIGDGANDMRMMAVAGTAVGFCPKKVLLPVLDAANFRGDHRFMVHLMALTD